MRNTGILQHLRFNTTLNCVTHHSSGGFRMARRCARSDLTLLGESARPKQARTFMAGSPSDSNLVQPRGLANTKHSARGCNPGLEPISRAIHTNSRRSQ